MNTTFLARSLAGAALALLGASSALAADDAQARYQKERAACMAGTSHQDRATCLREAGAALAEARRGKLAGAAADHQRNALERCNALPAADRADCAARIAGAGTRSGSVEGGGIYRETVTRSVEAPASAPVSGSGASGN